LYLSASLTKAVKLIWWCFVCVWQREEWGQQYCHTGQSPLS